MSDRATISEQLSQKVTGKKANGKVVAFDLGDVGTIYVDGRVDPIRVTSMPVSPIATTVSIAAEDLTAVLDQSIRIQVLMQQNRVKMTGDHVAGLAIRDILK